MKNLAIIHKITIRLRDAFQALGCQVELPRLESLSALILRSMTGRARVFHGYSHVFDVAKSGGPHEILAALYHDVVYYQVDKGFPPVIRRIIEPFMFDEHGTVRLNPDISSDQYGYWMCLKIFGLESDQVVSLPQGLNEFLSAVVCAQQLSPFVSKKDLLKIIACIEATIPFRKPFHENESVIQTLQRRVSIVAESFNLTFSSEELDEIAKSAVTIANNDLENFALKDTGEFLSHTWRLMPELNVPLQFPEQHTIRDYRIAIQKMLGFFYFVDPQLIYLKFKDHPSPRKFTRLQNQATFNIQKATKYLEVILVGMSILESIALVTGGDLPMAMMMGDVRRKNQKKLRMEDHLPQEKVRLPSTHDKIVWTLVSRGRHEESVFDMRHSPLAAYLYPRFALHEIDEALANLRLMFENNMTPQAFLETLPNDLVVDVVRACAQVSLTRAEALKELARELKSNRLKAA